MVHLHACEKFLCTLWAQGPLVLMDVEPQEVTAKTLRQIVSNGVTFGWNST